MKAVMETAAEEYRRKARERRKGETLIDVPCPSGTTFKCRPITVPFMVSSGMLPLHLVEAMEKASGGGRVSAKDAFLAMPLKEKLHSIEMQAKVVKYVCVEPRIVETPTEPNDLGQDELELEDFHCLVSWAMSGGDEAARLETFRQQ